MVVADDIDGLRTGGVKGGAGYDILIVTGDEAHADVPWTFDLSAMGFESAVGSAGNDSITASIYIDENGEEVGAILSGRQGNDTLIGSSAEDVLDGGLGNDVVSGGYGSDIFVYRSGDGADTVYAGAWADGGRDAIAFGLPTSRRRISRSPEAV